MSIPQAALLDRMLGMLIGVLWVVAGRFGLARVRRRATPLLTADWQELLDAERRTPGSRRR